jgi:Asp/Glu/hydantoin racemase
MTSQRLLIINPNSNETVTQGLRESLANDINKLSIEIECVTLPEGPFGIETDEDISSVIPLIQARIDSSPQFDAYVIACYSDPGLEECRNMTEKFVLGIQRSALETAISIGNCIGVLALSAQSIARHSSYIEALGFTKQFAGELPLDISVDEATNDSTTLRKIISQGRRLIDEFDVDVLILGCAGMAAHRQATEAALQVPTIDPTQAAVSQAAELLSLSKHPIFVAQS